MPPFFLKSVLFGTLFITCKQYMNNDVYLLIIRRFCDSIFNKVTYVIEAK